MSSNPIERKRAFEKKLRSRLVEGVFALINADPDLWDLPVEDRIQAAEGAVSGLFRGIRAASITRMMVATQAAEEAVDATVTGGEP